MKRILLILAITTMATSITSLPSPAKAFTWDDAWNAIKKGAESSFSKPAENSGDQSSDSNSGLNSDDSPNSNGFDATKNSDSEQVNSNNGLTKVALVIKRDDFIFEYFGCRKAVRDYESQRLDCIFKITYTGNDEIKDFQIINARAFSSIDGNQYDSASLIVAGKYNVDMIPRQPIQGVISFDWSPALKRLSSLEFETNNTNRKILIRYKKS